MNEKRISRHAILATAITLIAIYSNGATSPSVRLIVLALMAATIVFTPSAFRGSRWLGVIAIACVACSLFAFLPAGWFPAQPWRLAAGEIGIELPATVSPNPLLSLQSICMLVAGLAWLYFLSTQPWARGERSRIVRVLGASAVLLGALYITLRLTGTHWPKAAHEGQLGPFANKNQTGTILMLGGILVVGLLNQPGNRQTWHKLGWGLGLAVLIVALVAVGSRSALILFTCGAFIVSVRRATLPSLAVAGSLMLLTVTALIVGKADVLDKFAGKDGIVSTSADNGRWTLYADSWDMTMRSPLTGVGAGNFEEVFGLHRNRSAAPNRALHPDSDAVWTIAELGIPGAMSVSAFALGLLALAFPFARATNASRRDHSLRITCLIAAIAFGANALVDVPAHRLGSLLPGALVLALALNPMRRLEPATHGSRWLLGSCATASVLLLLVSPSRPGPLDADQYLAEAQTRLAAGALDEAGAAFEKARFLRPENFQLALEEGYLWLGVSPHRAIAAWRIAIERATRHGREEDVFNEMFKLTQGLPDLVDELWLLSDGQPGLQVIALGRGGEIYLDKLLASNPQLREWNHDQIAVALKLFAQHRSADELLALVGEHPDWSALCWRPLARALAAKGDHIAAFKVISSACPPPDLSILESNLSVDALRSEFARTPMNLTNLLRLAYQHMRRGNPQRALQLLEEIDQPVPPIAQFMTAHCLAQESKHQLAHQALIGYAETLE